MLDDIKPNEVFLEARYEEHNIIEVNELGKVEITGLGALYGLVLVSAIHTIKTNEVAPVEVYECVDIENLPEGVPEKVFEFKSPTDMTLTPSGMEWLFGYFERHPFNDFVYQTALNMQKSSTVDKEYL